METPEETKERLLNELADVLISIYFEQPPKESPPPIQAVSYLSIKELLTKTTKRDGFVHFELQEPQHKKKYSYCTFTCYDPIRRTPEESVNKLKELFSIVLKPTNWELERKVVYQLGRLEGSVLQRLY
ncbi:MAG: hypothetical protein RJA07_2647 [Bacteroidota bacterium]|jgi:hypothetical protein